MTENRFREIKTALLLKEIEKLNDFDLRKVKEIIHERDRLISQTAYERRIRLNSQPTVKG